MTVADLLGLDDIALLFVVDGLQRKIRLNFIINSVPADT
jgi:hypothetical protein